MWIKAAEIRNIRSIEALEWEVPDDRLAGWHVILGDNGSGKTTFLRALALTLVGRRDVQALRVDLYAWPRRGAGTATVTVRLARAYPDWAEQALHPGQVSVAEITIRPETRMVFSALEGPGLADSPPSVFSAGYGPFRRFTGGSQSRNGLPDSYPAVARHLSLFGEDVALTECLEWLQQLKFRKLETGNGLLDSVVRFVNESDLLPQQVRIHEVTSEGVTFIDGNGITVPVEDLSDGFRSILSMTFELIRQLDRHYRDQPLFDPDDPTRIAVPGIVLIDEVDAHLHPTWQRRVGLWFREHFPRMQFIVTTHSPLVCQAADVGTVFRLPTPGTSETGRMLQGIELDRLVYGNVLDAYGTDVFGPNVTRSDASRQRLSRLAELNQKERHAGLTPGEAEEQRRLRAMMPTSAHVAPEESLEKTP